MRGDSTATVTYCGRALALSKAVTLLDIIFVQPL